MTEERETIIKEWITALRSGEYRQTKGGLRALTGDGYSYCCLGVLCDLAARRGVGEWGPSQRFSAGGFTNGARLLPEITRWSGLRSQFGHFMFDTLPGRLQVELRPTLKKVIKDMIYEGHVSLSNMNDAGLSFATIADVIEARPEGLFMGDD